MKAMRNLAYSILAVFLITACGPVARGADQNTSGVRAWFDAPLPNTVFFPPSPCQIVAHGAAPDGIAMFELMVNGAAAVSIPSPDTQNSLVTLSQDCGVSEPGEYTLQLRAQDKSGNWSGYAETNLIIAGAETPPPATEPPATEPPLPTPSPTPAPASGVSIESVSTNLVYLGRGDCGPLSVAITARANAPKNIKVVVLFYRFQNGNSSSDFQSMAMNPLGGDQYMVTLNPTSLLGGSVPFDLGTLQYQVVVQQEDGDTSLRTAVMADIALKACGSVSAACSSYNDASSCRAAGCKWVSIPALVPTYECKNP